MNWRAAESVKVLLAEINALFPGRDKRTDGVISGYPGSVSSHQVNSAGVVCAVDITVGDYPNGITPAQAVVLAEAIRHELKVAPRGIYAYIIYDRRMARSTHDWEWEPYAGTSPHTDHIHVSVDWDIPEGGAPSGECPYDMTDTWNLRGLSMVATTLPTSRPVTQDWNQDFNWLNGVHYPNGFYSSIGWHGHNGIDYGCYEGDPIEAVCDGVIEFAGPGNNHALLTGGGNAILLRNDALGVKFEYLHLSRWEVPQGAHVKRGQVIARSGNTGISTAPHLHLGAIPIHGVNVNNGYRGRIDPTPYLYGPNNPDYAGAAIGPAGTTTIEEDPLAGVNIKALNDAAATINGLMETRWLAVDKNTNRIVVVPAGTPGCWPARLADVGDILNILYTLADQKPSATATVDTAAVTKALVSSFGPEFASNVAKSVNDDAAARMAR